MTLKEYIEELNKLVKQNPKILELPVIYSADDEGNHYQMVHYTPTLGTFDDFDGEWEAETVNPNAVCIN